MMKEKFAAKRNPKWSRDELILTLDFFLDHSPHFPDKASKEIAELSSLLNELGSKIATQKQSDSFRNSNGVYMKLMNLRRFDPDYKGKGLQRGSKDEQIVWDSYFNHRDELKRTANVIKAMLKADLWPSELPPSPDLEEAPEGQLLTRMHSFRERNREIVKNKKAQALERDGQLKCEVCGFDFEEVYGETGEGFIECHHTKPVSKMSPTDKTKLADLALVCSNCHRMIHHQRPWLTIDDLKSKLKR